MSEQPSNVISFPTQKAPAKKRSPRKKKGDLPFPPLGFVRNVPGGINPRNFWAVKSTGDYSVDCMVGRAHAMEYLAYLAEGKGGWDILRSAVCDMAAQGDRSGLVVGFMGVISRALAASMFAVPELLGAIDEEDRKQRRYLDSILGAGDGQDSRPLS